MDKYSINEAVDKLVQNGVPVRFHGEQRVAGRESMELNNVRVQEINLFSARPGIKLWGAIDFLLARGFSISRLEWDWRRRDNRAKKSSVVQIAEGIVAKVGKLGLSGTQ
jgi:hypothetical protein